MTVSPFLKVKCTLSVVGGNPCENNNGGCSHVCTPSGDGVECSCPSDVGLVLQNGGTMCVSAYNNCTASGTFVCRSGKCIAASLACDGDTDCDDGSALTSASASLSSSLSSCLLKCS